MERSQLMIGMVAHPTRLDRPSERSQTTPFRFAVSSPKPPSRSRFENVRIEIGRFIPPSSQVFVNSL